MTAAAVVLAVAVVVCVDCRYSMKLQEKEENYEIIAIE